MQILVTQFVQSFLVENAFIPKPISLFVQFLLEVAGQDFLYLSGEGFTPVKREEFQQMLLGGG